MTTKVEALAQGVYYPEFIWLEAQVADHIPTLSIAKECTRWLREAGFGAIVAYSVQGMDADISKGPQADFEREIAKHGDDVVGYFALLTKDHTHLSAARGVGGLPMWHIRGRYPTGTIPRVNWMAAMAKVCLEAAKTPAFRFAQLARHEMSWAEFPPSPPLAEYNHVVTVTEKDVAEAYEDPASFFTCWDSVANVGDQRVCIRALDKLDVEAWLGETFESTMHLARIAKPRRTIYHRPADVRKAFAPWWEYGDIIADERAGYPALSFVGYDPTSQTVEYAGFCTDTDIAKGGPDPRHVLIRELHEIRALGIARRDRAGNPIENVRVVFPEEWMARRERRPLLDVGARVYFMGSSGKEIEVMESDYATTPYV